MTEIIQLSEQELFLWIKQQLENRNIMFGHRMEKTELKEELYEILFEEQRLTVEEIEKYFIPFGQAGYLSAQRKFELMLFVLEKDYGKSFLFMEGDNPWGVISSEEIEAVYLEWTLENRMLLSVEEKKEFFVQNLMDRLGLGVLEVLKRIAADGVLLGELCPALYEQQRAEERIAVYIDGQIIRFPFLKFDTKEELVRIIKYAIAMENKGELTMMQPIFDFVKEDGTCITAVRPPAGRDWGIRILYGAAGKEAIRWKK